MTIEEIVRVLRMPGGARSQATDLWIHVRAAVASDPFARAYKNVRAHTMSGGARLRGLYQAVQEVTRRGVPGDIVECGTARGGSAALLALAAKDSGLPRRLWLFDTFDGIPAPTAADPDYDIAERYTGRFRGSLDDVKALFNRLEISDRVQFVKGRFEETVPRCSIGPIAVLHLDGDWYESVRVCLEHLYSRVSPGGIIQIDDYGHWKGARKAVDEFVAHRDIQGPLRYLDYTGRQLLKA